MPSFSFEEIYIVLSAVVALGIWVEMVLIRRNDGKMPNSSVFHMLSLLDSLWVTVSVGVLYFLEFDALAITVPVGYIVNAVLSWIYAARIMGSKETLPSSPDEIVFDGRYLSFCQSFALVCFLMCSLILFVPKEQLPFLF